MNIGHSAKADGARPIESFCAAVAGVMFADPNVVYAGSVRVGVQSAFAGCSALPPVDGAFGCLPANERGDGSRVGTDAPQDVHS